ncbi:hypothetical protein [Novosphingobium sp. CECT 9465]|uniref:hypothetical protein n=1 Tax=Novosphingobium sp. CECT 9465 TaxID=2829794 RepID=UPI001E597CB8|nr:hypothetical protein [Novosphingobium sp. CECT 9465]CAH0498137.1 hypothetical protein NVSP9465_03213 [Novosphingobium sp. CECT 9465]
MAASGIRNGTGAIVRVVGLDGSESRHSGWFWLQSEADFMGGSWNASNMDNFDLFLMLQLHIG